ncbi:DUF1861 family protein [Cellulomonas hominis]|uniref:DUF1861 family protein n=1 Tax=Cellulomonas hominis TaxID=156981 RepID=UPI001BD0A133|nr:DUF1861 family protein [Cellulomonas hominis]
MPPTVRTDQLLAAYRGSGHGPRAVRRLAFDGVGDRDVYNVSAPFAGPDGTLLLAGRVEHRADERSETVLFGRGDDGTWRPLPGAARPALQDPFVFQHDGATHLGGVEVVEVPDAPLPDGRPTLLYRTVVLRLVDPWHPASAFAGPWGMKDLRFAELRDGRLAVLTRPQGGSDGRGRIGVTVVPSLAALTLADVATAPRLEHLFAADEWGGVNQAAVLDDGTLGLLGHIARFDAAGDRHYYPFAFVLDPGTLAYTAPRLLFERADLPPGASKRPDLADVVFPGAMVPREGGVTVYCGAGDAEAFEVDLDPVHEV